jgi:hypothetical protein
MSRVKTASLEIPLVVKASQKELSVESQKFQLKNITDILI